MAGGQVNCEGYTRPLSGRPAGKPEDEMTREQKGASLLRRFMVLKHAFEQMPTRESDVLLNWVSGAGESLAEGARRIGVTKARMRSLREMALRRWCDMIMDLND